MQNLGHNVFSLQNSDSAVSLSSEIECFQGKFDRQPPEFSVSIQKSQQDILLQIV